MIGRLKRVSLREVWKNEAADFTTWLQHNLDVLNEVLPFSLESAEREQAAGNFAADLVAQDVSGSTAIIENQLEKSDHDHLGKIITYLASFGARAAVWLVSEARPEHATAVAWLNQTSLADFYLIKVEAVRIGDSQPAPLCTVVVGPSAESREIGRAKKELSEGAALRQAFWEQLLELSCKRTALFSKVRPGTAGWVETGAGFSGVTFAYVVFRKQGARVEVYIDRGSSDMENLALFRKLQQNRAMIEEEFGSPIEWQELSGKRACRICYRFGTGGWADPDTWPVLQRQMVDTMVRFEKAFRPHIDAMKLDP
ncbi:MAG: DUF4268 domain-containing protein [Fimbriimonadia bacterium]|jgi:hypothetical protein